ncbi:MAG TPA: hypothetical protein VM265_09280 [Sphingomicrobium sp.]|nr:hypothetical protein [Sphingomicrobium sp.]
MSLNSMRIAAFLSLALVWSGAASAAQPERPAAVKRLVECRAIADSAARLSCYDREVASFDAAAARQELVVVDREQVKKTRRSLFGLSLPNLGLFDNDDAKTEQITQIDSTIRRAAQNAAGKWVLTLADGAVWTQTDSRNLSIDPKPGDAVKIRRAALGSYLANIRGQVGIRVDRLR